ncbi:hypothetical protein JL101_032775 (plasmid) [Skermanella rosea]|uniref:hypothetical protein n=1 Tax=Skermanella rosea TaxID=1817965 RepID=UPI0019339641|nr:hypothetical protein [Skermanella rosea]UEM07268.1 hypothetical protein JL101_032775 [Skermanella rosea]
MLGDRASLLALERTAAALGRLDSAVTGHPLAPAWRHRTRLASACRHAATDGHSVDPHRLGAMIEGLRLTVDRRQSLVDRSIEMAGYLLACRHHRLMAVAADSAGPPAENPDSERTELEAAVGTALAHLRSGPADSPVLSTAAAGLMTWLERSDDRGAIRAAIPRLLVERGLMRSLCPNLTGDAALRDGRATAGRRLVAILDALAEEADEGVRLLGTMERAWLNALDALERRAGLPGPAGQGRRRAVRSDSPLPRTVTLLASAPTLGPAQLARVLGRSIPAATTALNELVGLGVAVELTGRRTHRLYGLPDLAPLRLATAGPRRPQAGMIGRPPLRDEPESDRDLEEPVRPVLEISALPHRHQPDMPVDLDALLADTDRAIARTKRTLAGLAGSRPPS